MYFSSKAGESTTQFQLLPCLPAPLHHLRENLNRHFGTDGTSFHLLFWKGTGTYGSEGEGKQQGTAQEVLYWLAEVGDSARAVRAEGKGCSGRWEDEEE